MNKAELAEVILKSFALKEQNYPPARRQHVVKLAHVNQMIDAFHGAIINTLSKGGVVKLEGFGTFETRVMAARSGRNPRTGAAIKIKSSKRARFRAAKLLVSILNIPAFTQ